ncbi:carbohydrate-selective porin [Leptolyngbya sp. Heron Island J]|uniref:iron uptake porin n=1 Tax=Leptolyngbya sp. Heron Island J TaxID=1385935 RepID=UPI0003B9C26C|nr:iron uptake porin [Leptolyngbya sp. Heron Island J]ESA36741.1 carbohydrate-selective porin [Leptolyngbya sp. Heron Island J]
MSNLWNALLASPFVVGTVLSSTGIAAETVSVDALSNSDSIQLAQVTSVSELSDVLPSDWAYTALQRLVEEYGCIEGYPDRSFRGNRAMTRYEFAAGLNACLDVIVQLIDGGSPDDLETIRRLQEEFAAELATIRGRVDTLEADVAELEANQFSTTTKLKGQLDAHLVVPFETGDDLDGNDLEDTDEPTFEYRARLNFDTSFTGEDRLRIRLQASDRNDNSAVNAGFPGGLASQSGPQDGSEDNLGLDDVYYSFPIGSRISAIISANSTVSDDFVTSTIVPFDGPSVGDFGGPIFYDQLNIGGESLGVGFNVAFTDNIILDAGYATGRGQDSTKGIFDEYEYIVQLNYLSDGLIDAAVTYMDGEEGDGNGTDGIIAGLLNLDFGGFEVGGYFADQDGDESWMGGVAFTDFLGTGSSAGAYIGEDFDDNLAVEGYYSIEVNEFWSLTPAVLFSDPDDGDENIFGVIRSTFSF